MARSAIRAAHHDPDGQSARNPRITKRYRRFVQMNAPGRCV